MERLAPCRRGVILSDWGGIGMARNVTNVGHINLLI